MVRGFYTEAAVSVHDLNIHRLDNGQAILRCTLRVKGQGNTGPVADVQEVGAAMRKVEGDWLFAQLTLVEVLER